MVVKGIFWVVFPLLTIALITVLCILLAQDPIWCNEDMNAGKCEKFEIDKTCYCIDMINENLTGLGLYEQAQSQCQILDGMLATPEDKQLLIWLAKKMFSMGIDNAFVGLEKIGPKWFWTKAEGAQEAMDIPWRKEFPADPNEQSAMINVKTAQVEDEDDYFGYKNYNYNHYIENDPTYNWYGFTTSDNSIDGDFEKAYLICQYTTAPEIQIKTETTTQETTETHKPADPCDCSTSDEVIQLNSLEDSATFTSPKYPSNYCSDLNCRWIVKAKDGLTINLDWLVFSVEKEMDFVYIYDGETDDSPLIDECTSSSCTDRKSSSNVLHVHFSSDHVTTDLGFKARVTAIDPDPCYCSEHSKISLTNLGESFRITSPNYPGAYCPIHNCKWSVSAPRGLGIHVTWNSFNLEDADSVLVYNATLDDKKLLQTCKGNECKDVVSYYEGIYIEFVANGHSPGTGTGFFSAILTVVENYCAIHPEPPLGSISYSNDKNEKGSYPVGTTATLECPADLRVLCDSENCLTQVLCDVPNWNAILDECTRVCQLMVEPITNFTKPTNLCHYNGEPFYGIKNGQVFSNSLVPAGQSVTLSEYVNNIKTAAEVFFCENGKWMPEVPVCNIIGVLITGGETWIIKELISNLEYASPISNTTMVLPLELSEPRTAHISITLGNGRVLIAGGRTIGERSITKSTELIDLNTGTITQGPPMLNYRTEFAAARFNGEVWVCGHTDSCEKLTKAMKWIQMKSMREGREKMALAAIEGQGLYAMGGVITGTATRTVEKYTVDSDSWTYVARMNAERGGLAATTLNGYIYACGGEESGPGSLSLNSCERYDPGQDTWIYTASMIHKRNQFNLIALGDKLYAMLGGMWLETVEEYHPTTDTWHKNIDLVVEDRALASATLVPYLDDNG